MYGLWTAASLMCDGCSDDGFTDFRAWLIAQGKDAYMSALADPDSLAELEVYDGCRFEELTYAGDKALEKRQAGAPTMAQTMRRLTRCWRN